ncbi:hypothetical protein GP486_003021 [Trichoglossum hirsutum]|uniref:Uncharacterized protein n=1 Tax=Trichoglossum hirsutum TaxID=265104 RepID=A0A9P8LE31_9PEZI|nr:hypothetical protein GP486_003021 [Trichoglossum hirsutum]
MATRKILQARQLRTLQEMSFPHVRSVPKRHRISGQAGKQGCRIGNQIFIPIQAQNETQQIIWIRLGRCIAVRKIIEIISTTPDLASGSLYVQLH